ncbi:MAG: flavodoxin [Candidatus Competibacteraceae bacterium]|nr:flavodoxin [Candidatus Competibacteraceae bacterium]
MAKIGLFYATDTGNTRKVAKLIKKQFDEGEVDLFNVKGARAENLAAYDALIFGTPTLGDGELPEPLTEFLPILESVDLSGKTVALFGLGDQIGYPDEFVDALGILYKKLRKLNARLIGGWPAEGYEFSKSKALRESEFVGLVLDQDNQADLTEERLEEWLAQVRPELLGETVTN